MDLGFFQISSPDEKPEVIEPEQIFVNRSGTTENTGQDNPLNRHPDILARERDDGQQVPDCTVSGRCLGIRLAFFSLVTISGARCLLRSYAFY